MNIPKVFWVALAIFEIAFGTAIFMVTRSYYKDQGQADSRSSDVMPSSGVAGRVLSVAPPVDLEQPRTPDELARLADTHFSNRQYEAAVVLYEQLLGQDPTNIDLMNNLALTLHYVGRSDEALRLIGQGVALDTAHQRIRLTHGFILGQVGRTAEAVGALNEAIAVDQTSELADSARRMLADMAAQ